jgi:hypothetical protein
MVALSFNDKERVYFHLGMGARVGIDAGDLAQVEEACNTIFSEYMKTEVLYQLDICDDAYDAMKATKTTTVRFGTKEFYAGDVNRTILREQIKDLRLWKENYREETRNLAQMLHVPNYNEEGWQQQMFSRTGSVYINALPGVADTSVASRKVEFTQLAGSFGF